jgi:dipeptidyl aminopeptidase/acylaminoacyl peptidase
VFDWTGTVLQNNGLREMLERRIVKKTLADAPDVYRNASPIFHVGTDAPPTLVIHGDLDTLAPVTQAREFVAKLRATSRQPVVFVELRGAHHAFEVFNSVRTMHTIAGVDFFLAWLLSAEPDGLSPPGASPTRGAPSAPQATDPIPTARTGPSRRPRVSRARGRN